MPSKILFLIFIIFTAFLKADNTFLITQNQQNINLSNGAKVYLDTTHKKSFKDIKTKENLELFETNKNDSISYGFKHGKLWVHFVIENKTDKEFNGVLDSSIGWIDQYDVYIEKKDSATLHYELGNNQNVSNKPINTVSPAIPIRIQANDNLDITICISGKHAKLINPVLYTNKSFEKRRVYWHTLIGSIIGVLVAGILVGLFLFFLVREKIFLYYSLFILSIFIILGSYYGYLFQIYLPETSVYNEKIITLSIAFYSFSKILFSRHFLQTKHNMPIIDKIFQFFMGTYLILIVAAIFLDKGDIVTNISLNLLTIDSLLIVYVSFRAYMMKIPGSLSFLVAWTLSNVAGIIASMLVNGNINYADWIYSLSGLTNMIDIILFSYALAERTIILKKINQDLKESNIVLESVAMNDALTGVFNRRFFDEQLQRLWEHNKTINSPVSLVMIDIDYFKQYNDRYGHQAGDRCLQQFASEIKNLTNDTSAIITRYGGEEFALIVDANTEIAIKHAQEIKDRLKEISIPNESSSFGFVTASFGIATYIPKETKDYHDLIKSADEALYKSKNQGRNQYTVY